MSRVSVVVPTAARPSTLEVTLRSIARQTRRDLIREVIVSENLSDRRSEEVCALFPELPITYKLRDPQLDWALHMRTVIEDASSEMTAFVCDDDIWAPGHLGTAVMSLDEHPEAVAHFSAFDMAESELARKSLYWATSLIWLAAGRPPRMSEYLMDAKSIYALGWMVTPFQWSTLVGRTDIVKAAAPSITEASDPYYSDRMFCLDLADRGTIVYDPAVDTLYRSLDGAGESQVRLEREDPDYLPKRLRQCEREVCELAKAKGWDVAEIWRTLLADLPADVASSVAAEFMVRFTPEQLREFGFEPLLPAGTVRSFGDKVSGRLTRAWKTLIGARV